jgi:alanine dehydrogenase
MPSAIEQAVRRLEAALQGLEIAVQQRLSHGDGAEGLAAEVEMLAADRARLAESLDQSQARAAKLESVNREVSKRIGQAVEAIGAVLHSDHERQQ